MAAINLGRRVLRNALALTRQKNNLSAHQVGLRSLATGILSFAIILNE